MAKQLQRTYVFTPGNAGVGTVQIPGRFDLSQLLIITNVTKNTIIYNFADLNFVGTTVSFSRANTSNFPQILQNSDGVTTITLGVSRVIVVTPSEFCKICGKLLVLARLKLTVVPTKLRSAKL